MTDDNATLPPRLSRDDLQKTLRRMPTGTFSAWTRDSALIVRDRDLALFLDLSAPYSPDPTPEYSLLVSRDDDGGYRVTFGRPERRRWSTHVKPPKGVDLVRVRQVTYELY